MQSKQATAILDALDLLDGDQIKPQRSRYAKHFIDLLAKKGQGHVLNRNEILHDVLGVEYDRKFRLEPEWVVVVLAALVYTGDITLSLPGKKFDANCLDQLASTSTDELVNFKHIERPKEWNLPALKALFELLGLAPGLAVQVTQGDDVSVQQLQIEVGKRVDRIVAAQQHVHGGIPFWSKNLLAENGQAEFKQGLDNTKSFLESLQAYTSPGKMKNFRYSTSEVQAQKTSMHALQEVEDIAALVADLGPQTSYLSTAEAMLAPEHPWTTSVQDARTDVLSQIANPKKRCGASSRQQITKRLADLKSGYIDAYLASHGKARLGVNDDKRKVKLLRDKALGQLQKLSSIDLMPRQQLTDFQNRLAGLKTCYALTKQDIDASPTCPHCGFRPANETVAAPVGDKLAQMEQELEDLHSDWTKTLLTNLDDPTTKGNLGLLREDQKKLVETFLKARKLPAELSHEFIKAVQEVLSGLQKVTVKAEDLKGALLAGGSPCTIHEMKKRFDEYLADLAKGQNPAKVRIVIE